ncbi:MBOAT family protein [candidate division KSB1 bacterium]|nr:MBOAT family protein [candidate division KSB1 bacterium]
MLFNSLDYAIFLPIVLFLYYRLQFRQQNLLLLLASYVFYGFWDVRFLSLIFISTIVDYGVGLWLFHCDQTDRKHFKKLGVIISLTTNLGILGFFKYFDFFVQSADSLLSTFGLSTSLPVLNIILPVGISFYTFQTLSYTLDIYRGKLEPTKNLVDFALFVGFFPQLVAGPIERAANLLPQIQKPRVVSQDCFYKGVYLIITGLVRKVVIADTAGAIVDTYFANPGNFTGFQLTIGLLLYGLQIYGDFAGYSNIARGSAYLLGFELMRNFKHPYFSKNMTEFWHRWHISLSGWLRDYLYISLGGNRKGRVRTYINLMTTMLLGGLWHGANWNFVFWGFLHGLYLVVHKFYRQVFPYKDNVQKGFFYYSTQILSLGFTLCLANFTWLFFRSTDIQTTQKYLAGLTHFRIEPTGSIFTLLFLTLLVLLIDIPQTINDNEFTFLRFPVFWKIIFACAALLLLFFSGGGGNAPFIYFQF